MRGSGALRTGVTPGGALAGPWVQNSLWTAARAVPSLDLRFADNKSLTDAVTGASLVTFTRASSGTLVGSDGVLRSAVTNLCLQSEDITTTWTNFQSTDAANTAIAPNGTLTADTLIVNNGANSGLVQQQFTLPDSTACVFSVYVKAAGSASASLQFYNKANTFHGTKTLNLNTGALTGSDFVGTSSAISVGDGWYRFLFTGLNSGTGATTPNVRIVDLSTGNGTAGIYVWGAQLEQSSTVGEYIPTTSAINSAPRFDHNPTTGESLGLLVEEQRTNLLSHSQQMDAAPWGLAAATAVANDGVAPDGTTTADRIVSTGGGNFRAGVSIANATAYTYSVFLKSIAGTGVVSQVGFERFGSTPLAASISVNLTAGTITNNGAPVTASSITRYPNNWYRVSVTATSTDVTTTIVNYASASGNEFLTWGAQLE